jgi:hypothetical protein
MKFKCKICGRNAQSDYCFAHKPRTPLKRTALKPIKGIMAKVREGQVLPLRTDKEIAKEAMKLMFLDMWRGMSIPRVSEVSGTSIGNSFSSIFFHHILPKSKYPEAMLDRENIIILTGDEHANVENDMYKYEKINIQREVLKKKYNL